MSPSRALALAAALLASGCSTSSVFRDAEVRAQRMYSLADSLERGKALREAAFEYALVAEHYPGTSLYRDAVRKAAFLYCDPFNPGTDDSIALHWLGVYRTMSLSDDEARNVRMTTALLRQIRDMHGQMAVLNRSADSLMVVSRRLGITASSQGRRAQELEDELRRVNQELARLKDVDLQMSRSRQKK